MQYYYSEHECSLCFVKGCSIPLVLMSRLRPAFFFFFFKRTKLGHACGSVRGVSSVRRVSDTSTAAQMKCLCFLVYYIGVFYVYSKFLK